KPPSLSPVYQERRNKSERVTSGHNGLERPEATALPHISQSLRACNRSGRDFPHGSASNYWIFTHLNCFFMSLDQPHNGAASIGMDILRPCQQFPGAERSRNANWSDHRSRGGSSPVATTCHCPRTKHVDRRC